MGDFCGALFGAIVALGLASGRENLAEAPYPEPEIVDESTRNPKSFEVIREFYQNFVAEFGGTICRDILLKRTGRVYDFVNPDELKRHRKENQEECANMVGRTARLAAEAILELPRR